MVTMKEVWRDFSKIGSAQYEIAGGREPLTSQTLKRELIQLELKAIRIHQEMLGINFRLTAPNKSCYIKSFAIT